VLEDENYIDRLDGLSLEDKLNSDELEYLAFMLDNEGDNHVE
jgi:hypothetical protein